MTKITCTSSITLILCIEINIFVREGLLAKTYLHLRSGGCGSEKSESG
jgi:hypothetical protein